MKIYSLNSSNFHNEGSYGMYFHYSDSIGIKIINKSCQSSIKELFKNISSEELENVVKEATIGKIFNSRAVKGLCIAKFKRKYYLGIVMRHCNAETIFSFREKNEAYTLFVNSHDKVSLKKNQHGKRNISLNFWAKNKLWEKKIISKDLNMGNILVYSNKSLAIIDFDPSHNYFHGKKRHYYRVKNRLFNKFMSQYKNNQRTAKVF